MKFEGQLFKRYYPGLDLLRSAAIILVMIRHFGERGFALPAESPVTNFIFWGFMGVSLFFVLSGFLIGGQIMEDISKREFSFYKFYLKRFWRIFPPYYFSILVVVIIYFTGLSNSNSIRQGTSTDELLIDVFYHVLFLQNYISLPKIQGSLYWTLGIEEQFYIIIPLALFIILKYFGRGLTAMLVSLLFLDVLVRFILYDAYGASLDKVPFYLHFSAIVIGVLSARIYLKFHVVFKSSFAWKTVFLITAVACLGVSVIYSNDTADYFNLCWGQLTWVGFAALLLLMMTSKAGAFISRGWFFSLTAKLSYTMYLYHLLLVTPVVILSERFWGVDSFFDFFLVFVFYFVVVSVVSAFVYRLIDRPCMGYRRRAIEKIDVGRAGSEGSCL